MKKTKDKSLVVILALLLGGFGIHYFYLGKNMLGVLMILFCWTGIPLLIAIIDFIRFACMSEAVFDKRYNQ